jgi:F-type H+-transporting ATPase subunit delta
MAKSNYDLVLLLKNPIVNSEKKLNVLKALFPEKSSQKMTLTFFEIISRKNREEILIDVAKEFEVQYNIHKSIQVAEVTTTVAINADQRKAFVEAVKEISGLTDVQLVEKINPAIIGGFVLKVNDRQLDDSLSSKLRILKSEFIQNHYEKQF